MRGFGRSTSTSYGPGLTSDSGDPGRVCVRELPNHGASIPALCFSGRQASCEGGGIDVAVVCVCSSSGLSNDYLVQRNARSGVDLEDRSLRVCR